jgi:ATP-binding cassette, subfamily B, bacterial
MRLPRLSQTIREDIGVLHRSLCLIRAAGPRYTAATAFLTLVGALLPVANVWLLKHIIDTVATVTRGRSIPADASSIALALALSYLFVVWLNQVVQTSSRFTQAQLSSLLKSRVTRLVMAKASDYPDLSPFESPCFYDRLELLHREAASRLMSLEVGLAQGMQSSITLFWMLLFLARFHPALAVALVILTAPSVFYQRRLHGSAWYWLARLAPLRRRLDEYARVLLTAPFAKEVRLFGFSGHILARYDEQSEELISRTHRTQWHLVRVCLGLSLLASLGVGGAFAYVIDQALGGALTLGDLSLYTGALLQANSAAGGLVGALAQIHDALPLMRELFTFLDSTPTMRAGTMPRLFSAAFMPSLRGEPRRVGARTHRGFRLERVVFRYPEMERPVFDGLELEIPWGKATALVGENGSGKSTLVKLLTRLYDPVAGRVLLNGIDLRDYDLEDLRRHMAVIFQDFARYQLPVWENIGLGDVNRLGDRQRTGEAARRAGADEVIRRLPLGEETILGREFEGGVELSGGEWQKIALARAFMRHAPILILDEPSAALDARSEHATYCRFRELAKGRTAVLISHRLSAVRMADRILVLDGGVVVEEGDHRGLVARGGCYAELYAMQAERYRP